MSTTYGRPIYNHPMKMEATSAPSLHAGMMQSVGQEESDEPVGEPLFANLISPPGQGHPITGPRRRSENRPIYGEDAKYPNMFQGWDPALTNSPSYPYAPPHHPHAMQPHSPPIDRYVVPPVRSSLTDAVTFFDTSPRPIHHHPPRDLSTLVAPDQYWTPIDPVLSADPRTRAVQFDPNILPQGQRNPNGLPWIVQSPEEGYALMAKLASIGSTHSNGSIKNGANGHTGPVRAGYEGREGAYGNGSNGPGSRPESTNGHAEGRGHTSSPGLNPAPGGGGWARTGAGAASAEGAEQGYSNNDPTEAQTSPTRPGPYYGYPGGQHGSPQFRPGMTPQTSPIRTTNPSYPPQAQRYPFQPQQPGQQPPFAQQGQAPPGSQGWDAAGNPIGPSLRDPPTATGWHGLGNPSGIIRGNIDGRADDGMRWAPPSSPGKNGSAPPPPNTETNWSPSHPAPSQAPWDRPPPTQVPIGGRIQTPGGTGAHNPPSSQSQPPPLPTQPPQSQPTPTHQGQGQFTNQGQGQFGRPREVPYGSQPDSVATHFTGGTDPGRALPPGSGGSGGGGGGQPGSMANPAQQQGAGPPQSMTGRPPSVSGNPPGGGVPRSANAFYHGSLTGNPYPHIPNMSPAGPVPYGASRTPHTNPSGQGGDGSAGGQFAPQPGSQPHGGHPAPPPQQHHPFAGQPGTYPMHQHTHSQEAYGMFTTGPSGPGPAGGGPPPPIMYPLNPNPAPLPGQRMSVNMYPMGPGGQAPGPAPDMYAMGMGAPH